MPATPAKKTTAKKTAKAAAPRAARVAAKPPVRRAAGSDPFGKLAQATAPAPKYSLGMQAAAPAEPLYDLEVPSGALCQVRRPGVSGLVAAGILDGMDSLTGLVQTEHIGPKGTLAGKKVDQETAEKIARDPAQMAAGFALVDKLAVAVVVQPALWIDYRVTGESDDSWAERQEDAEKRQAVAVSNVALTDRLFIMQWAVGGSADLAAFREGFGEALEHLDSLQGFSMPS